MTRHATKRLTSAPRRRRLAPSERKQELLEATREVIQRYGYHGASVPRVVTVAGTSQGNFYRYFKNLDEAFLCVVREPLRQISAAAHAIDLSHATTPSRLESALLVFYQQLACLLRTDAILLREALLVGQAARGPVGREITGFLRRMRSLAEALFHAYAGRAPFRPNLDPAIVSGAMLGMIVGAVQEAALLRRTFDVETWAVQMARFETGALVDPAAYATDGRSSK